MLYICNYLNGKSKNICVLYSDEYDNKCYSFGCMKPSELEKFSKYEHKLSEIDIYRYAEEWSNLKKQSTNLRIVEKSQIKLVSYNYYI